MIEAWGEWNEYFCGVLTGEINESSLKSVSYYQKYRPDKIDDLDLTEVREQLSKILGTKNISHAYLFVGPRGSGKTSAARILARVVNCQNRKEGIYQEPCGKCEACKSIKTGSCVDVLEIDAASHGLVDDIRDLREKIRLAPVVTEKKVYIIDEVHMMSNSGFNALLKTLEEPPSHAIFILCTTEDHKVPETIASRCVKVLFKKGSRTEVKRALQKAVKGEKLKIGEKTLDLLAGVVDGSLREAHKVLEQLAIGGKEIDEESVRGVLGLVRGVTAAKLIGAIEKGEGGEVLEIFREIGKIDVDPTAFVKEMLSILREKIYVQVGERQPVGQFEKEMVTGLIEVSVAVKSSPIPMLPLEVFCLLFVETRYSTSVQNNAMPAGRQASVQEKKKPVETHYSASVQNVKIPVETRLIASVQGEINYDRVVADWPELLTRLTPKNHSVVGLLRGARPKEVVGNKLIIEVFYEFHKSQLEQVARREMIESEVAKMWGPMMVTCVLGNKAKPKQEVVVNNVDEKKAVDEAVEVFG